MNYTQEQLQEAYRKLPQDVQEAMFSINSADIIMEIGQKYKLTIDKMGELADETGLVMLGFTHPRDYISHLTERLSVNREIAKEIAEEVNLKVFYSIREQLKKIHGLEQEAPAKAKPLQAPRTDLGSAKRSVLENTETKTEPAEAKPLQNIFEAKTKEEIFRSPKTVSEKDPYRESI